jgi:acetyltransferase-like isoleucine patch superfamily enzyme
MVELKNYSYDLFKEHYVEITKNSKFFFGKYMVRNKYFYLKSLKIRNFYKRCFGDFSFDDRIKIATHCEPPMVFLRWGCAIPYPFGSTLSVDEIGADCRIGQNVTIGMRLNNLEIGDGGVHIPRCRPKLGNLVHIYSGAVVSGNIRIGDRVIIAANAFVDKDVPGNSIVYGVNKVSPLKPHHYQSLANQVWYCKNIFKLLPGLVFKNGKLYVDTDWSGKRDSLISSLRSESLG